MESRDHKSAVNGPRDRPSQGWPLGLEPLNFRMRVLETLRFSERNDFQSFKTPSFTSESSSDFETNVQSPSSSFFLEKPITLGEYLRLSTSLSATTATNSFGSLESPGEPINMRNASGWWTLISCADEKINTKTTKGWWDSFNCACAKARNKSSNFDGIKVKSLLDEVLQVNKFTKSNEEEKVYTNVVFEDTSWSSSNENPLFYTQEDLSFAKENLIDL